MNKTKSHFTTKIHKLFYNWK